MKTTQEILFEKFQSQDKVGLIRSELVVLISEAMQAYADQQVKAEREKVIQKVMESALAFTRYTQTVPISISELKEILLKLKSHV